MDVKNNITPNNNSKEKASMGKYLHSLPLGAFVGIFILLLLSAYFTYAYVNQKKLSQIKQPVTSATATPAVVPQKTEFGTALPTDFPTDIPIEKGIKVNQSYRLDYVGQQQLTVVFLSTKTVKENYTLYSDFLKKQSWTISNKYESPKLYSLYGTKGSNDINVTISADSSTASTKSQVSISVLKK